jgi:hypothetical protein
MAIAAMACRAPASSDRLEGHWVGVRAEGVSGLTSAEARAAAQAFVTATEIDFRRNQITVTTPRGSHTGRYDLIREDPRAVVIATDRDGPAAPQTFVFNADDSIRWVLPDGKSILFERP